jgi:hypothetical protein
MNFPCRGKIINAIPKNRKKFLYGLLNKEAKISVNFQNVGSIFCMDFWIRKNKLVHFLKKEVFLTKHFLTRKWSNSLRETLYTVEKTMGCFFLYRYRSTSMQHFKFLSLTNAYVMDSLVIAH